MILSDVYKRQVKDIAGIVGIAALAGIVKTSNKGENNREDIEYMDEDFGQKYGWKK